MREANLVLFAFDFTHASREKKKIYVILAAIYYWVCIDWSWPLRLRMQHMSALYHWPGCHASNLKEEKNKQTNVSCRAMFKWQKADYIRCNERRSERECEIMMWWLNFRWFSFEKVWRIQNSLVHKYWCCVVLFSPKGVWILWMLSSAAKNAYVGQSMPENTSFEMHIHHWSFEADPLMVYLQSFKMTCDKIIRSELNLCFAFLNYTNFFVSGFYFKKWINKSSHICWWKSEM